MNWCIYPQKTISITTTALTLPVLEFSITISLALMISADCWRDLERLRGKLAGSENPEKKFKFLFEGVEAGDAENWRDLKTQIFF